MQPLHSSGSQFERHQVIQFWSPILFSTFPVSLCHISAFKLPKRFFSALKKKKKIIFNNYDTKVTVKFWPSFFFLFPPKWATPLLSRHEMTSCNCAHMFFLNMRPGCGVFQGTQRGLSFFSVSALDILSQQTCSQFMLKLTFLFKICASATVLVSTSLDRDKSNARNKMQLPAMEILTGCLGKSIALTTVLLSFRHG